MAFEFHPEESAAVSIDDEAMRRPEPGMMTGLPEAIIKAAPRAALKTAETLHILGTGVEPGLSDDERDAQFKRIEDTYKPYIDAVTPSHRDVGAAGQVLGSFLEEIVLLMSRGGAKGMVAASPANVAREMVGEGVSAEDALKVQSTLGITNALGFKIPFMGKTLTSRVLTGVGTNVALGAGVDASINSILTAGGNIDLAELYDPMNAQSRLIDTLLGGAFGGIAHVAARTGRLPPDVADSTLALNSARQVARDALPGRPTTVAAQEAHHRAADKALDDLSRGVEVDVAGILERQNFAFDRALEAERASIKLEADKVLANAFGRIAIDEIPRADSLGAETRTVETRFRSYLANNFDEAQTRYDADPETAGGRILNTDTARKLSRDYSANRDAESLLSSAVHEPASWFVKRLYAKKLAEEPKDGQDAVVLFTGGGTGAGKTSAIRQANAGAIGRAQLIYDTNGNGFDSTVQKIDQAVAAGKEVQFVYVARDPIDALVNGSLTRAMNPKNNGRTVPIRDHVATHRGSAETLERLMEHYKDNDRVNFDIVDNTRGKGQAREGSIETIKKIDFTNVKERLYAALETEFQAGRITEPVYLGTKGIVPAAASRRVVADAKNTQQTRQAARRKAGEAIGDTGTQEVRPATTRVADLPDIEGALANSKVIATGIEGTAVTERGNRVRFRYAVIDAADLRTSHTDAMRRADNFDQNLQPRERDRDASELQVARIEGNVDFGRVSASPTVADGAPMLGADDQVESGNARSIAIRRAYKSGRANGYRQSLQDAATQYGLDPQTIAQMEAPVLVRQRMSKVPDRAAFAIEANEQAQARMSLAEQARADASQLTNMDALVVNEDGSINMRESEGFLRAFSGQVVSAIDQGAMLRPDGRLSTEGLLRVRNAIFAKAYGDPDLVSMMVEGTDQNVRTVLAGLMRAAGDVGDLREGAQTGYYHGLDLSDDIAQAARLYADIKSQGMRVVDYFATAPMFDAVPDTQVQLLQGFEEHGRSAKRVGEFLQNYVEQVRAAGNPNQAGMFAGEPTGLDRAAMVKQALAAVQPVQLPVKGTTVESAKAVDVITENPDLLAPDAEGNIQTAVDVLTEADDGLIRAQTEAELFSELSREDIAAEGRGDYSIESPRAAFNPDQMALTFDEGVSSVDVVDRMSKSPNVIAQAIAADFELTESAAIIGRQVRSPEELGVVAQMFRHPSFETLRYVFLRDGVVIHATGITQRNPSSVAAFASKPGDDAPINFEDSVAMAERLGADQMALVHNHPTGNPSPSQADQRLTAEFSKAFANAGKAEFMGHVVVNHGAYSVMKTGSDVKIHRLKNEPLRLPDADNPMIGRDILGTDDMARVVGNLRDLRRDDSFVLVTVDGSLKVSGIIDYPKTWLQRNPARLLAEVRRAARNTGGSEVFLVGAMPDEFPAIRRGFDEGVILDALPWDGSRSALQQVAVRPKRNTPFRVARDKAQAAHVVRSDQNNFGPDADAQGDVPLQDSIFPNEPPLPAGKKLTDKQKAEIKAEIRTTLRNLQSRKHRGDPSLQGLDDSEMKNEAARRAAENWVKRAQEDKRYAAMRVVKAEQLQTLQDKHPEGKFRGLVSMMVRDKSDKGSAFSFEAREMAVRSWALARLLPALNAANPRLFGLVEDNAGWRRILREIYGENSGDPKAKKAAKAWNETHESMREQANFAGFRIPRLYNYKIPQIHSRKLVEAAGVDKWVADVLPKMDRDFYVKEDGQLMTTVELIEVLRAAHSNIVLSGMSALEAGAFKPSGNRAKRHQEHRELHFASADGYADYLAAYGGASIHSVITGHVQRIARDIALVQTFGPNPEAMYRLLRDKAEAAGETDTLNFTDNLFNEVSGKTTPGEVPTWAEWSQGLRNLEVSSKLGGAALSSVTDFATMHITGQLNNLPAMQLFRNQLSAFNPANKAERVYAQVNGLGLDTMLSHMNRWGEEGMGGGWTSRVASGTLRLSGLQAFTDANKRAFGVTMMGGIGGLVKKHSFKKLSESDARILGSKGITETDFKVWKAAKMETWGDVDHMLTPQALARIPDDVLVGIDKNIPPEQLRNEAITKLLGVVLEETDVAVITAGLREKAIVKQGTEKGTPIGELVRHMGLFKSFPVGMIARHWSRALSQPTMKGKVAYTVALFGATSILGAISLQMKDVAKGQDPRSFRDPRAWLAAFSQGGGLGIYGDFLFSDATRYGNSLTATIAGPSAGTLEDIYGLTLGNMHQAFRGDDTDIGAEAVRFAKQNAPLINLWYTKTALDRLILNDLQDYLSPGYLNRVKAGAKSRTGSEFWWEPGETAPDRAPNPGAMFEEN